MRLTRLIPLSTLTSWKLQLNNLLERRRKLCHQQNDVLMQRIFRVHRFSIFIVGYLLHTNLSHFF
jgi:hypothetical protein